MSNLLRKFRLFLWHLGWIKKLPLPDISKGRALYLLVVAGVLDEITYKEQVELITYMIAECRYVNTLMAANGRTGLQIHDKVVWVK